MNSRLIIAGAGSGKTTYLINESLKIKNNNILITTFTDANEQSIREKFFELEGCIPTNITIMTWYTFLLHHGVKPYQSIIYDDEVKGIVLVNKQSGIKCSVKGKPIYYKEEDARHYYFDKSGKVYSDKIAKFTYRANERANGYVIDRIGRIYPNIFIDEVQDMAGYDLELIRLLNETGINLQMVGDPRQVTYHTHYENKNKKYADGAIAEYIGEKCKDIIIDEQTLNVSHRNTPTICDFANKLYPDHPQVTGANMSDTSHDGIFLVSPKEVNTYISKYSPIQLRDSKRTAVSKMAPAYNFGESKGLTFDRVLIYPTKPITEWLKNQNSELSDRSRAKLYVAITRAKSSVAFIDNSIDAQNLQFIQRWHNK